MPISNGTRQTVGKRANYLYEYHHSPERFSANRFIVDRIMPSFRVWEHDRFSAHRVQQFRLLEIRLPTTGSYREGH